jgi:hypothetical protein
VSRGWRLWVTNPGDSGPSGYALGQKGQGEGNPNGYPHSPPPSTPQGCHHLHQVTAGRLPGPGSIACYRPSSSTSPRRPFPLDCLPFHGALWYFPPPPIYFLLDSRDWKILLVICPWDDYLSAIRVSSILWNQFGANFRAKPCLMCLTSGIPESPVLVPWRLWSLRPYKDGDSGIR